jgi:hypothetical protein
LGKVKPRRLARRPPAPVMAKATTSLSTKLRAARSWPPGEEIAEPAREDHQHRHRGAGLDENIEQVRLAREPADVLHQEQMAGGGDGRNSVMPSMIPRAITAAQSGTAAAIRLFPRPRPPRSHCR